jgi:hypothetical protein
MSGAPQVLAVRVPLAIRRHGGRKVVLTPQGAFPVPAPQARIDSTLVKALARAHRWKRLMENGQYTSISEMSEAERIDRGYLGRILRLTLLAPDIVEAILDGRQPDLGLARLMDPFPTEWGQQRSEFGVPS